MTTETRKNPYTGMSHSIQIAKSCVENIKPHLASSDNILALRGVRDAILAYEGTQLEAARVENNNLRAQINGLLDFLIGNDPTEVTMQMLNDVGINPFGTQLVCESFVRYSTAKALKFKFQGVVFHFGVNYEEALSQLPKDYLDTYRKEREVIRVAGRIANLTEGHLGDLPLDEWENFLEKVSALNTNKEVKGGAL